MRKIFIGETLTVALISCIEKVCIRRGVYQGFPSKLLCLTVANFPIGESFTVVLFSGFEKVWIRGGNIKILRRKNYVSQRRNFS